MATKNGEDVRLENRIEVKIKGGLHVRVAGAISWAASGLKGGKVTLFAPSGEGVEWSTHRPDTRQVMVKLIRLGIEEGDTVNVVAEGNHAKDLLDEIERLLSFGPIRTNLDPDPSFGDILTTKRMFEGRRY